VRKLFGLAALAITAWWVIGPGGDWPRFLSAALAATAIWVILMVREWWRFFWAALAIALAITAWFSVGESWSFFLVVPYLVIGVICGLVGFGGNVFLVGGLLILGRRSRLIPPQLALMLTEYARSKLFFGRYVINALSWPLGSPVLWPPIIYRANRSFTEENTLPTPGAMMDMRLRRPFEANLGLWLLSFAALLALLVGVSGHHWYLRVACYAVIIACLSNQVRIMTSGSDLSEELRTTLRNPFLQLVLIAVSSFLALTIAAFALLRWPVHASFRWDSLWSEGWQILGFTDLRAVWQARPTGATEILVAITGVTVYVSLISQLWKPLRFKRTSDDCVAIAMGLLLAGDRVSAKRWLETAQARGQKQPKAVAEALTAEGAQAMADGDFDVALERARVMAQLLRRNTNSPEDQDDARFIIADWAASLSLFDMGQVYSPLVSYLVTNGISDPCLAAIVFVETTISSTYPGIEAPSAEIMKPEALYPLTVAAFEMGQSHWPQARARLDAIEPVTTTASLVKRILIALQTAGAARAEDPSKGREVLIQDTSMLITEVNSWSVDEFPMWLRKFLQLYVEVCLENGLFGGKQAKRDLQALRDSLAG
jgi:hypothetical protein